MTTYSTGNPLGSSDPRDLYDNAENLDNFVNGAQPAYDDRLGQARKSWAGMEQDFAEFLANSGYVGTGTDGAVEDYAAGIEVTAYNQIIRDGGEFWRAAADTELPYTTDGSGMPEDGAFVSVGDAVLRQDLSGNPSDGEGAALVNGATIYVGSVAELEALSVSGIPVNQGARITATGRKGDFYWDGSDLSNEVSGDSFKGVYVPPTSDPSGASGAWIRGSSNLKASHFGIVPGIVTFEAISSAIEVSSTRGGLKWEIPGLYQIEKITDLARGVRVKDINNFSMELAAGVHLLAEANVSNGLDDGLFNFEDCSGLEIFGKGKVEVVVDNEPPPSRANLAIFHIRPSNYYGPVSPKNNVFRDLSLVIRGADTFTYSANYAFYGIRHASARHPSEKSSNVRIEGITFRNSSGRLVQITNCDNSLVRGCSFIDCGADAATVAVRVIGSYDGAIIQGNLVHGSNLGYITAALYTGTQDVNAATSKVGSSSNVVISNNKVSLGSSGQFQQYAVRVSASTDVVISGNVFADRSLSNVFLNIARTGIEVTYDEDLKNILITDNVIDGFAGYARTVDIEPSYNYNINIKNNLELGVSAPYEFYAVNTGIRYQPKVVDSLSSAEGGATLFVPNKFRQNSIVSISVSELHSDTSGIGSIQLLSSDGSPWSGIRYFKTSYNLMTGSRVETVSSTGAESEIPVTLGSGISTKTSIEMRIDLTPGRRYGQIVARNLDAVDVIHFVQNNSGTDLGGVSIFKSGENISDAVFSVNGELKDRVFA